MRFALAGGIPYGKPISLVLSDGSIFKPRDYEVYGYTFFDVICVGGSGGNGGHFQASLPEEPGGSPNYTWVGMGGAGGGGGFHRIAGPLSALPDECPVVVGQGGAHGNSAAQPADTTVGQDGETSSFNTHTCYASGGKGGHPASFPYSGNMLVPWLGYPTGAGGGQGGRGNRLTAGNGAPGGNTSPGPPTSGNDGGLLYNGRVGIGGGGGCGGLARHGRIWSPATIGGIGAFDILDDSVMSSPRSPSIEPVTTERIGAGGAGGASVDVLTGLPQEFGRSFGGDSAGGRGGVVIALSADAGIYRSEDGSDGS